MPHLKPQQVNDAIARGVNAKISDGHNLYLIVKNGRGFWVHQFRDGPVIRSKGFGSAATVTLAEARRAREAFSVARRAGIAMPGIRSSVPRGDAFGKAAATYLANHADEWSERHRKGLAGLLRTHGAPLASVPVNRITPDQVAD